MRIRAPHLRWLITIGSAALLTCSRARAPEVAPQSEVPPAAAAPAAAPPAVSIPQVPPPAPEPVGGIEPEIAIGLVVGATSLTISSEAAITVTDTMGTPVPGLPASQAWAVAPDGAGSRWLVRTDGDRIAGLNCGWRPPARPRP
ncbi:MAG: hypothetical protein ACHQ2E_03270 [Gemmatimonadales bacterium]